MTSNPLITIIIPTRDRPDLLDGCLASLRANPYPHREIIVVDQSAGGETEQIVRKDAEIDPSIRYVYSDQPGSSHANNIGLAMARGVAA